MAGPRNPARSARREIEALERLGTERPQCMYCGFAGNPVAFHKHHPLGKNHDPEFTVLICLNCHALAHEILRDAGIDLRPVLDPKKQLAARLRAKAIHLEQLAKSTWGEVTLLEETEQQCTEQQGIRQ